MGVYNSEGWAMFYTAALLPLKEREQNSPMAEIRKELRDLSGQYHTCPDGKRRKISLRTWIRRYKRMTGDFRNQMRKQRKDKSVPRSLTGEIVDRAIEIKKDMPTRSCSTIIKILESEGFNQKIAKSSLSRHLLLASATTKVLQNPT